MSPGSFFSPLSFPLVQYPEWKKKVFLRVDSAKWAIRVCNRYEASELVLSNNSTAPNSCSLLTLCRKSTNGTYPLTTVMSEVATWNSNSSLPSTYLNVSKSVMSCNCHDFFLKERYGLCPDCPILNSHGIRRVLLCIRQAILIAARPRPNTGQSTKKKYPRQEKEVRVEFFRTD